MPTESSSAPITPDTLLERIFRLAPTVRAALDHLHLETAADLLNYFPATYSDPSRVTAISDCLPGETVTVSGVFKKIDLKKSWKSRIPMAYGTFEDSTGTAQVYWFNQAFIAKKIQPGTAVSLTGQVHEDKKGIVFTNPEFQIIGELPEQVGTQLFAKEDIDALTGSIFATYAETRGITSKWLRHAINRLLTAKVHEQIDDPIPDAIRKSLNLPSLQTAYVWVHEPKRIEDATSARKRFAFQEVFTIQTHRRIEKLRAAQTRGWTLTVNQDALKRFEKLLGFELTGAQKKVLTDIISDMSKDTPMSRLVEGDVGSGKTALAALAAFSVVNSSPKAAPSARLQVAYLCPTEILAKQHFSSFMELFAGSGVSVGFLTGTQSMKFPSKLKPKEATDLSRTQFLKYVASGEIHIVIGTHALLSQTSAFRNLGLAIIDEQHRFGTFQRQKLAAKDSHMPHLLSMTATPIPRTLALTVYGDLDLSVLDELPPGRKPPVTQIVNPKDRDDMYEKIRIELDAGRQAYVVCPRINESEVQGAQALQLRSVKAELARLQKTHLADYRLAAIHGKMNSKEKDAVMQDFKSGKIQVLIATSVVEVGVSVANATVILIEGGERYGLAQLHQLRGRVLRSSAQAYCYVAYEKGGDKALARLKAFASTWSGFELAEHDLAFRGAGDLYGVRQSGLSDLGMEALANASLVSYAREHAAAIVTEDPTLAKYPALKQAVAAIGNLHFE